MRALEIGGADVMRLAIQQQISRFDESWYDVRLHGLLRSLAATAASSSPNYLGDDRQTAQRWVMRCETH